MFRVAIEADDQVAPVRSSRVAPEAGAVDLDRGAVVAILVQHAAPQKNPPIVAQAAIEFRHPVLRMYVVLCIDRAPDAGSNQNVPVGSNQLRAHQTRPFAEFQCTQERVIRSGFGTVAGGELKTVRRRPHRDNADHTADGARSIEVRGPAAHQLDRMDHRGRQLFPVDPAAKRVQHGDFVKHHQRTASRGRAQSPQRNPLGGGVCYQRAGAAE